MIQRIDMAAIYKAFSDMRLPLVRDLLSLWGVEMDATFALSPTLLSSLFAPHRGETHDPFRRHCQEARPR